MHPAGCIAILSSLFFFTNSCTVLWVSTDRNRQTDRDKRSQTESLLVHSLFHSIFQFHVPIVKRLPWMHFPLMKLIEWNITSRSHLPNYSFSLSSLVHLRSAWAKLQALLLGVWLLPSCHCSIHSPCYIFRTSWTTTYFKLLEPLNRIPSCKGLRYTKMPSPSLTRHNTPY